ncbi:hypothetical protein NEHOM01_1829 [Nematocida homosporus]|uniref:uncharacterized protein n=1 Tax=Nematocida homosporus TaxID=1912981 RepID=UPI00221E4866|nr:uncharacterized protein NEHOM01_1829 [Nematocida homosporus]KAI5186971.1 hypothetical protein NEHOM01_1829 [Nematocida homosporus]
MKIFAVLLLQCKKIACRTTNMLVPVDCNVSVSLSEPKDKDLALMEAQKTTIAMIDVGTNEFILPKIVEGLFNSGVGANGGLVPEMMISSDELSAVLESASLVEVLGKERVYWLFNVLFGVEITNGALACQSCSTVYPVVNGIVDFLQKPE